MAGRVRWRNRLPNGDSVEVVRLEKTKRDDYTEERTTYLLSVSGNDSGHGRVSAGAPDSRVTVADARTDNRREFDVGIQTGSGVQTVHLVRNGTKYAVFLPDRRFLATCTRALDADTDAIERVLAEFESPAQVPAVCGSFLSIEQVGELVEAMCGASRHASSRIHSYRYDLIRGALVNSAGLSIKTAGELETLVESFDENPHVGPVNVVEVLADAMATSFNSRTDVESVVTELGYDLRSLDRRRNDLFFVCRLGQAILTDGLRAAEGLAMERRYHIEGNYERRKRRAKEADYQDRGRYWREIVCASARQSLDEFAYALTNALYWSGEVSRTDSRMDELLFEAAASVAAEIDFEQFSSRARFERCLAKGHRLRSQNCYSVASSAFEEAEAIARRYDYLPGWEPAYSGAVVRVSELNAAGDQSGALATLDDSLARIIEYDVTPEKLNEVVHHLEAQKREIEAKVASFDGDRPDPVSLLEDARDHYDAIGFDRSRGRVERKLYEAKRKVPDTSKPTPEVSDDEAGDSTSSSQPTKTTPIDASSKPGEERASNHVTSEYAKETFVSNPDLDDFLTPTDNDEVGGSDLMTSPEDRNRSVLRDAEDW